MLRSRALVPGLRVEKVEKIFSTMFTLLRQTGGGGSMARKDWIKTDTLTSATFEKTSVLKVWIPALFRIFKHFEKSVKF